MRFAAPAVMPENKKEKRKERKSAAVECGSKEYIRRMEDKKRYRKLRVQVETALILLVLVAFGLFEAVEVKEARGA